MGGAAESRRAALCPPTSLLTGISPNPTLPRAPQDFSLHGVWSQLPQFLFYSFGISFLGVALAIGIFRPRKQMPVDMFQVGGRLCVCVFWGVGGGGESASTGGSWLLWLLRNVSAHTSTAINTSPHTSRHLGGARSVRTWARGSLDVRSVAPLLPTTPLKTHTPTIHTTSWHRPWSLRSPRATRGATAPPASPLATSAAWAPRFRT
jgi:hypothetical protein